VALDQIKVSLLGTLSHFDYVYMQNLSRKAMPILSYTLCIHATTCT